MTEPIDFSLTKQRLIWMVVCSALVLLLLFGAGVATGFLLNGHAPDGRRPRRPLESSENSAVKTKPPNTVASQAPPKPGGTPMIPPKQGVTIEAASFPSEREASHLAALLERDGYRPVSTGADATNVEPTYSVVLGPYGSWEQASRIATELNRSYDLRPVIRPVRSGPAQST